MDQLEARKAGVLGDGMLRAGKANMRLAERAIRERWPMPESLRKSLIAQMGTILIRGETERNKIAAAKVLVAADKLNLQDEQGPQQINVSVAQHDGPDLSSLSDEQLRQIVAASALLEDCSRPGSPGTGDA